MYEWFAGLKFQNQQPSGQFRSRKKSGRSHPWLLAKVCKILQHFMIVYVPFPAGGRGRECSRKSLKSASDVQFQDRL